MDQHTAVFSILLVVGILFTCGCVEKEGSDQSVVKESTVTVSTLGEKAPQPTAEDQAAAQIDSITASFDQGSYTRVEEIVDIGEPALPKLYVMLSSDKRVDRWASSYALSRIAFKVGPGRKQEIVAHLKPVLNDGDPSVRQTAAGTLAALGAKDAIPVLIEYLGSDETYYMSDPPEPLSEYSFLVLSYYTGKDFGYNASSWENWWAQNEGRLVWDEKLGEYGGYVAE